MAERIQVELVDDLDGSPAHSTVTFALDGVTYEIDLNERNAGQLRSLLDRYVKQARTSKPAGTKQKEREERRVRQANKDLTAQIRGAAQRTKERQHHEAETTQPAETPEESGETLLDLGTGVSDAVNRPSATPTSEASEQGDVAVSEDETDAERVPAAVMPQFSSAE